MMRVVMVIEMSWQVNEEVSRDMTGEADGKNLGVDSTDGVMHEWAICDFGLGYTFVHRIFKFQNAPQIDGLA